MNKITKISISSIILLSSLGTLENPNNKALANETTNNASIINTTESIVNKFNNNTQNMQGNLLADGPQKVVQNPGSMNWTHRNTQYGSTKLAEEGTFIMKNAIYDGVGYAIGGKIASTAGKYIGGFIVDKYIASKYLEKDKIYYYKNVYYTAKDPYNVYVKCESFMYSDKARTKLVYTTWAQHTY